MTIDDRVLHSPDGWIAYIYGPMFSGKTDKLVHYLSRAKDYAGLQVQAFKPVIDQRYGAGIKAHNGVSFPATDVNESKEIYDQLRASTQVIGISESQFLDSGTIELALSLRRQNKKVFIEGLLFDFRHESFPLKYQDDFEGTRLTSIEFLKISDYHLLNTALCEDCGRPALYTRRNKSSGEQVLVGGKGDYSATCRIHHRLPI